MGSAASSTAIRAPLLCTLLAGCLLMSACSEEVSTEVRRVAIDPGHPSEPSQEASGPSPEVIAGSRIFAESIHPAMMETLGPDWPDLGIKGDSKTAVGAQQGALTGSIFSEIPVLTVEMVVITQPEGEAFISSEEGQMKMARAMAAGIRAYFKTRGKPFAERTHLN